MSTSKIIAAAALWSAAALSAAAPDAATLAPQPVAPQFITLDPAAARRLVDPAAHTVPTAIALWSIECTHCKKNLALLADLAKTHPGMRLITLAVEPAEAGHAVPLDRLGVPGARFAYGAEAPERLAFAIDPDWHGELPRTLFFDGCGTVAAISGVVDAARARAALGLAAPTPRGAAAGGAPHCPPRPRSG